MKENKFWIIIGFLTLVFCWLFYPYEFSYRETYLVISSYLGRVASYLIFPAIIALIFKGVARIFKKEFGSKSFRVTFLVVWVILSLSAVTNFLYDSGVILNQGGTAQTLHKEGFEFTAQGNEYTVTFKESPEIKETTFLSDIRSITAELVLVNDGSYVRAESFSFNDQLKAATINREYIVSMLKEYAKYNGLKYPEFNYSENELGKIGKLRAYKTLKDNSGKKIEVTFEIEAYFGEESGIILHRTSPSTIYPTPKIVNFFDSIKKTTE